MNAVRMLYLVREEFPTHRVDVDVLFGREMAGRGNAIDYVMQAASNKVPTGAQPWHGRTVFVGATDDGQNLLGRFRKVWFSFWHDLASLRHASSKRYDAIQVRDKFLIAAIALPIAHLRGLKFFFWLSFPLPEDDILRAKAGTSRADFLVHMRGVVCGWLLYKWILPRCDHAFVQSAQMREDVCAHGIDPAKVTPVPMGIAAADVAALSALGRLPSTAGETHQPVLAYLGTLNGQRRLEVLIDMLALLHRQGMQAKLLLVGDGDLPADRLKLERRADELGVRGSLEITGFLPRAQALERMRVADICISPFFPTPVLRSTSPTKLVEYMALGMPVIANDHPEQKLVLRQSRAGLCVPWGAKYFARAVRALMSLSAERRTEMGQRGLAWVRENRTYTRIADDVEGKYVSLLGLKRTG